MARKLAFLTFGVFLVWLGVEVAMKGGFVVYGHRSSLADTKVISGAIFVIFGIIIICLALRKKAGDLKENFVICPGCRSVFSPKEVVDVLCPKCDVKLEDLEGFYDRHPELRDSD